MTEPDLVHELGLIGNLEGHFMIATYKARNKKYSLNNS